MLSDLQLAQTALDELRLATLGYANAKKQNPTAFPLTHNGKCETAIQQLIANLTPPPPISNTGLLGALRICTACAVNAGDLSWAEYVICHQWEPMRRDVWQGTGSKVLAYRNGPFASPSGGLTRAQMMPSWFATINGQPVTSRNYSNAWFADVDNVGYQNAWANAVISACSGFDGVMIDDINETMKWHLGTRTLDKYPDDASWQAAITSFLAVITPKLKAAGLSLVIPNISIVNYWTNQSYALWDQWTAITGGALQENWTKWASDSSWFTGTPFDQRADYLRRTQAAGNTYIAVTYGPAKDTRSQNYARAAFLLDYDPMGTSVLIYQPNDPEGQPPFSPIWTKNLGKPLGPKKGYTRQFEQGSVVLDNMKAIATIG